MLIVKHKLTIGSTVYTLGNETRLVDLAMQAALDVPVNACRVTLSPPKDLSMKAEDVVKVELGYGDSLTLVFTGIVGTVDWGIDRVVVHGIGSFQKLVAARFNLVYEKPAAGDIVSGVAGELGLATGKVEAGLKFAAYAVGQNRTAYAHLRALAEACGFDFYADTQDKVIFAKYKAASTHEFKYGVDILNFALDERLVPVSGVEIYGESPASGGQGAEAASWLTKKEVKGSAGGKAGLTVRLTEPSARTQEVANKMAEAILADQTHEQGGAHKVIGAPPVKLGDAVKVAEMPISSQNGTFKVIGVTHTLNAKKGFVTTIAVQEA